MPDRPPHCPVMVAEPPFDVVLMLPPTLSIVATEVLPLLHCQTHEELTVPPFELKIEPVAGTRTASSHLRWR